MDFSGVNRYSDWFVLYALQQQTSNYFHQFCIHPPVHHDDLLLSRNLNLKDVLKSEPISPNIFGKWFSINFKSRMWIRRLIEWADIIARILVSLTKWRMQMSCRLPGHRLKRTRTLQWRNGVADQIVARARLRGRQPDSCKSLLPLPETRRPLPVGHWLLYISSFSRRARDPRKKAPSLPVVWEEVATNSLASVHYAFGHVFPLCQYRQPTYVWIL